MYMGLIFDRAMRKSEKDDFELKEVIDLKNFLLNVFKTRAYKGS